MKASRKKPEQPQPPQAAAAADPAAQLPPAFRAMLEEIMAQKGLLEQRCISLASTNAGLRAALTELQRRAAAASKGKPN